MINTKAICGRYLTIWRGCDPGKERCYCEENESDRVQNVIQRFK